MAPAALNSRSASELEEILNNKEIRNSIFYHGASFAESRISVSEKLDIGIIQRPTIIGSENDFIGVTMQGIMGDVNTGLRLPGFMFMRSGRSIGVFGPPPNFRRRWNDKRRQSKKQAIKKLPLIVMINGDHVLGDPQAHDAFFSGEWLTENNSMCSAIGIIDFTTTSGEPELELKINNQAEHPIPQNIIETISTKVKPI